LLVLARNESVFRASLPAAFGSTSPLNDDDDGGVPTADDEALLRSTQS
jgi:hypothetical protein